MPSTIPDAYFLWDDRKIFYTSNAGSSLWEIRSNGCEKLDFHIDQHNFTTDIFCFNLTIESIVLFKQEFLIATKDREIIWSFLCSIIRIFRRMVLRSRIVFSFDNFCIFFVYFIGISSWNRSSMFIQWFLSLFSIRSINLFIYTFSSIIRSQSNLSHGQNWTENLAIHLRNICIHSHCHQ